jgi:hypothetical protein
MIKEINSIKKKLNLSALNTNRGNIYYFRVIDLMATNDHF